MPKLDESNIRVVKHPRTRQPVLELRHNDEWKTIKQWVIETGVSYETIYKRIFMKRLKVATSLQTPVNSNKARIGKRSDRQKFKNLFK